MRETAQFFGVRRSVYSCKAETGQTFPSLYISRQLIERLASWLSSFERLHIQGLIPHYCSGAGSPCDFEMTLCFLYSRQCKKGLSATRCKGSWEATTICDMVFFRGHLLTLAPTCSGIWESSAGTSFPDNTLSKENAIRGLFPLNVRLLGEQEGPWYNWKNSTTVGILERWESQVTCFQPLERFTLRSLGEERFGVLFSADLHDWEGNSAHIRSHHLCLYIFALNLIKTFVFTGCIGPFLYGEI